MNKFTSLLLITLSFSLLSACSEYDYPEQTNTEENGGDNTGGDNTGGDNTGGVLGCTELINDDSVNWRESSLQTDQKIIECLSTSLGQPVGYGESTTGGYDPAGSSQLVIITNDDPEDQIAAAIASSDHKWIVFDKDDFATETEIMMYRPYCSGSLATSLGVDEATCRDPQAWCAANNVSSASCLETFFNTELNNKNLPVRNYMIHSNTTIDGRGAKAKFVFNGFAIGSDSSGTSTHMTENVIITNNYFVGAGHTEDHELDPDMIRSTGESHDIWIHQNTFDTTGDSAFDVKVGAYDITISFNKLVNVKRAALHGSSDSRTINQQITTTMLSNLFVTTDEYFGASSFNTMRRVPLIRRGQTHLINNVFYGYRKDIMSVRVGARVAVDANLFLNPVNNSKGDDLADWAGSILADVVKEGDLSVTDSLVFESNSNCQLSGASASVDILVGTAPYMYGDYNSASNQALQNHKFNADTRLRDYVIATAGKGGKTPWLSSDSDGIDSIIATSPATCQ